MEISALFSVMLMLFLFICVGFVCSKTGIVDEQGSKTLNKVVLNICSPALVLKAVLESELTYRVSEILMLIVYAIIFNLLALLAGAVCARIFSRKNSDRNKFCLVSAFGNVAFMGFPVVSALYGSSAVFLVSICTLPFNVFVFSVGIMLVLGGKPKELSLKRIFVTPTMISTFIAFFLFLFQVTLPAPVESAIGALGSMVIPLSMMLIGISLGHMAAKAVFGDLRFYAVAFAKLIAVPLLVGTVLRLIVKDPLFYGVLVVMSAMPTAAITPVLSAEYGGDRDFASGCVFLTTILSMLTVPVMLSILLR